MHDGVLINAIAQGNVEKLRRTGQMNRKLVKRKQKAKQQILSEN